VDDLYLRLVSIFNDPSSVVIDGEEANNFFSSSINIPMKINPIQKMMAIDSITYLPDDILTKVDRAAMAVSLETRVPFLDHNVFEFAWRIPQKMKLRNGVGKWALRKVLYKHVPKNLIEVNGFKAHC
jgi:asparagine synthase (glutamine-hydrolysing)